MGLDGSKFSLNYRLFRSSCEIISLSSIRCLRNSSFPIPRRFRKLWVSYANFSLYFLFVTKQFLYHIRSYPRFMSLRYHFGYCCFTTSKDLMLGYSSFINEIAICIHVYGNPSNGWHFIDHEILFNAIVTFHLFPFV